MAVIVPNLDDRRFQDLVDDAKRLVQQRCPEWTDHNVSDPGVTLIETMAYLVDTLLYRLNRVPDKLYLTFLDLIGVRPHAPVAATADVTFWLTAPQDDTVTVPAATRVGTVRTDLDDAVEFESVRELAIPPRSLVGVATAQVGQEMVSRATELREHSSFLAFAEHPNIGDALLVGLNDSAPRCAVAVRWDCAVQGVGVNPDYPPLRWEAWTGTGWTVCDTEPDGTGGLNRPGDVIVHLPATHVPSVIAGVRAGWLRTVVTEPVPGYPAYVASPLVRSVEAFTVGATAPCVHAETVAAEVVGLSEGVPGQRFPLAKAPVVGDATMVLEVGGGPGWQQWSEVATFAQAGPADQVFAVDRTAGLLELGPAVREPDGSLRSFGAVPPKASPLRVPAYRVGGGPKGNIAARAIRVLRSSVPLIERVDNRRPAAGGVAGESMAEVRLRAPLELRSRDRAVTAADFEALAREAVPSVARLRCVRDGALGVRLLVVPTAPSEDNGRLRFEDLIPSEPTMAAVTEHLDARRLVGTRLLVEPPFYQGVTVVARLVARPRVVAETLREAAVAALYRYFNPIDGGPDGDGWPFGRPVHVGEVYAVLQRVAGTELVEDVRLFAADPTTGVRGEHQDRIPLAENALVFSFGHQARVLTEG